MRREVELYIGRMKVDLGEQSLVLMNYTLEDLRNPTILKNSYSQQIEIESTPNNDRIFGGIWRSDRRTEGGWGTGVDFDPSKKTSFLLFGDGELLESGYIKLDSVTAYRDKRTYKVSLYGGMGEFFQQLTYDDEGEKMSLASLSYGSSLNFTINKDTIVEAWNGIGSNIKWQRINFAPCYNGYPNDFDCDKVVMDVPSYPYLSYYKTEEEDGVQVRYESKKGYVLMKLNDKATEWEMQELRSYLQRPILRVKYLIKAICDAARYNIYYDPIFFNDDNPYWNDTWLTLPMLTEIAELVDNGDGVDYPRSDAAITKEMLLSSDKTPADYLISFCKMFGLHIVVDNELGEVKILTRQSLFQEYIDVIDIEEKVDISKGITITPVPYDSKWYTFSQDVVGEFAKKYQETNTKVYGAYRVNTGYEFSQEEKPLLSSLAYKGAVEVLEKSKHFANYTTSYFGAPHKVPAAILNGGSYQLYNANGGTIEEDITIPSGITGTYINSTFGGFDAYPKVQFHEAENKAVEGRDVILFYNGKKDVSGIYHNLRLTDDHEIMDEVNEGKPCWYYREYGGDDNYSKKIGTLPMFGRYRTTSGIITDSLDFGAPTELAIPSVTITDDSSLFARYWRDYIRDRYSTDSRVMTVWMRMQGLPQGYDLLRRFVYFQGAIWSVNKVTNQSLSSDEPVQVELVRVQNIDNYR